MSLFLVNNLILLMTSGQFEYSEPALVSPPSMGSTLLRLILSLIIVIVLIFLLIKFFSGRCLLLGQGAGCVSLIR